MIAGLKPWARRAKYAHLARRARRAAAAADRASAPSVTLPAAFVVGCGRSGTSILGSVIGRHPQVHYLREPMHLWAAVDPRTDVINFLSRVPPLCIMEAEHATPTARARFAHLFLRPAAATGASLLVEKLPINAMRIGYLEALAPGSRYVHIVRDCVDVCRSIAALAESNRYRIGGRPRFNQWWGDDDVKWRALVHDGRRAGCGGPGAIDEVGTLTSHAARGAYEWLLTLHEIDRWRALLASRFLEVRYDDLVRSPRETLARVGAFLGLAIDPWREAAAARLAPRPPRPSTALDLPPALAGAVNAWAIHYGFEGRARPRTAAAGTGAATDAGDAPPHR